MSDDRDSFGYLNNIGHDSGTQISAGVSTYDDSYTAQQKIWEYNNPQPTPEPFVYDFTVNNPQTPMPLPPIGGGVYYPSSGLGSKNTNGSVKKPLGPGLLDSISSLFHFVFIFIPAVFLYYIPIKYFLRFVITVSFLALAYMSISGVGEKVIRDYQMGLEPQNMTFNTPEYYGVKNKYINQYRKLDAEGFYRMHKKGIINLSSSQLLALGAVIKERLLANPDYFDSIKETFGGVSFSTVSCNYSRNYYSEMLSHSNVRNRNELALESGNFYFFEKCLTDNSKPASSYINDFPYIDNPSMKADYDRINNNPIFQITHHNKYVAYLFTLIAFLILSSTIIKSYRFDKAERLEKILAKRKEKLDKENAEKPQDLKDKEEESVVEVKA